jgi:hypothetical protein
MAVKVVVHYVDGSVLKGFTQNFYPSIDRFHLHSVAETSGKGTEIFVRDLKAVFFVRDFAGNPHYDEKSLFSQKKSSGATSWRSLSRMVKSLSDQSLAMIPNDRAFSLFLWIRTVTIFASLR